MPELYDTPTRWQMAVWWGALAIGAFLMAVVLVVAGLLGRAHAAEPVCTALVLTAVAGERCPSVVEVSTETPVPWDGKVPPTIADQRCPTGWCDVDGHRVPVLAGTPVRP